MTTAFVNIQQLTKRYGDFTALDACDLEINSGEVFGLLGPNGAGKTTLIRLLMGFLQPTSGGAHINGFNCYSQATQVHQLLSYLPGEVRLFRWMRGKRVLRFLSDVHSHGNYEKALEVADRLEVDLSRKVSACSSGMRQKLALCSVFSTNTKGLILDEPTTHLDPSARREVGRLVSQAKQSGQTVLFSSHVLSEVEEVCDRVAVLRAGKIVHLQLMDHLRKQHRIAAEMNGTAPTLPDDLNQSINSMVTHNGSLRFDVQGELAPFLGWLSQQSLKSVKIEPIGLKAIYERFHPEKSLASESLISEENTSP